MKRIFVGLFMCYAVMTTMSSCQRTPEKVAAKFVKALYTGDFEGMYKYTLRENHIIIKNLQDNLSERKLEEVKRNKIEIQKTVCTFQNDSVAECTCKFLFNDNMNEIPFDLRKSEGKWQVDLSLN